MYREREQRREIRNSCNVAQLSFDQCPMCSIIEEGCVCPQVLAQYAVVYYKIHQALEEFETSENGAELMHATNITKHKLAFYCSINWIMPTLPLLRDASSFLKVYNLGLYLEITK